MHKILKGALVVCMIFGLCFPWLESYGADETFILEGKDVVRLSVETYKEKDGLTPLILSVRDLDIMLWMDGNGFVTERPGKRYSDIQAIFSIDPITKEMSLGDSKIQLEISSQSDVRTRMKPFDLDLSVTFRINIEKRTVLFRIQGHPLEFRHIRADFLEMESGKQELRFSGPGVQSKNRFFYSKETGSLLAAYPGRDSVDMSKSRVWARKMR